MRRLRIIKLKIKRDEVMKAILPAIIRANEDSSAYYIVSFADRIINELEERKCFEED